MRFVLLLICLLACWLTAAHAEDGALWIKDVQVNSYIAQPYNGADFVPNNLIDGCSDTCWQVRLRNGMQLSDIFVDLVLDKPCDVRQLWIKNGFWRVTKGYNQYIRNSRVKALAVSFRQEGSDLFSDPVTFELPNLPNWRDTSKPDSDWLRFDLEGYEQVACIRLTILEIHKGNKYPNDIAISEVQLMGMPSGYIGYTINCRDQDGISVPNVAMMLVGSSGSQSLTSDAQGQASFSSKPETYRLYVTSIPQGYQVDMLQGYELPQDGSPLEITLTKSYADPSARAFSLPTSAHSTHRSAAAPRPIPISQNEKITSYLVSFAFENRLCPPSEKRDASILCRSVPLVLSGFARLLTPPGA